MVSDKSDLQQCYPVVAWCVKRKLKRSKKEMTCTTDREGKGCAVQNGKDQTCSESKGWPRVSRIATLVRCALI